MNYDKKLEAYPMKNSWVEEHYENFFLLQKIDNKLTICLLCLEILLKRVHSIIFVSNIFPNSHLIQKSIQNQQLFQNSSWFIYL